MDNLEMEFLKKEIEELKSENERLSLQIHNRTDTLGAMLVFVICVLIVLLLCVAFMVWKFYQLSPVIDDLLTTYGAVKSYF